MFLVRDIHGDGCEFLGGERVPVTDGTAKVLLCVVIVAPLRHSHRRHVLVHVDNAAMPENVMWSISTYALKKPVLPDGNGKSEESGGRRVRKERVLAVRLQPVPE